MNTLKSGDVRWRGQVHNKKSMQGAILLQDVLSTSQYFAQLVKGPFPVSAFQSSAADKGPLNVFHSNICIALREVVEHFSRHYSTMVFSIHCDYPGGRLAPNLYSFLFHAVFEGLNNAVKHAEPSRVWVSAILLESEQSFGGARELVIAVEDDGCGIDFAAIRGLRRGLRIIEEKAKEVGVEFELESAIGRGTTLWLSAALS